MEIEAPSHWRCVDFISDLHLHGSDPLTFAAWCSYLQKTAADAVFVLGDLFEVWVGDDVLSLADSFEQRCAAMLRAAARRLGVYIMPGNRDFLMGPALMQACGTTLLPDPTVLTFAQERFVLTHGDALCLADTEYQQFRAHVRSVHWQRDFLQQPLAKRLEMAQGMRAQSEAHKRTSTFVDVDSQAVQLALQTRSARYLIHGHTHRPETFQQGVDGTRLVLSDWDLSDSPPRSQVLRLSRSGDRLHLQRLEAAAYSQDSGLTSSICDGGRATSAA